MPQTCGEEREQYCADDQRECVRGACQCAMHVCGLSEGRKSFRQLAVHIPFSHDHHLGHRRAVCHGTSFPNWAAYEGNSHLYTKHVASRRHRCLGAVREDVLDFRDRCSDHSAVRSTRPDAPLCKA